VVTVRGRRVGRGGVRGARRGGRGRRGGGASPATAVQWAAKYGRGGARSGVRGRRVLVARAQCYRSRSSRCSWIAARSTRSGSAWSRSGAWRGRRRLSSPAVCSSARASRARTTALFGFVAQRTVANFDH